MILKKIHSQEFTDQLNSVDEDIKWTTGEMVTEAPLEEMPWLVRKHQSGWKGY